MFPVSARRTAPSWPPVSSEEPIGKRSDTSPPSWETRPPNRWAFVFTTWWIFSTRHPKNPLPVHQNASQSAGRKQLQTERSQPITDETSKLRIWSGFSDDVDQTCDVSVTDSTQKNKQTNRRQDSFKLSVDSRLFFESKVNSKMKWKVDTVNVSRRTQNVPHFLKGC